MNVKDVIEIIIAECKIDRLENTVDKLIVGDWDAEVTGIITTFMATIDVIEDAIARGANLIISHEPIYFTHQDHTDWLTADPVYLRKQKLIEDNHINIWRFHDYMHRMHPDLIFAGLNKELGWESYELPEKACYVVPKTTVEELALFLKKKLEVITVQIVGDPTMQVERVGMLVGGMSMGIGSGNLPMELMRNENLDVIVCGEILEWTLCAYVRDADQLGLDKALIIIGHNRSEEIGMKHLQSWLEPLLPDVPIQFSESGEPFTYV